MCGLVAWFDAASASMPPEAMRAALDCMRTRGPDDEGVWHEPGVALGHRRLAILDLDHRAAQPMNSACGRYAIVFNGEIYNYRALRAELIAQGTAFRTSSDTEVLLELFASSGESMLPRLQGMFAFVIWDRVERHAFAARDPYGIKPLFVARTSNGAIFGSQVRALLATGLIASEPDLRGQAGFWLLGSVPEPHTWFQHIRALPAGHCCWLSDRGLGEPRSWSDIGDVWRAAEADAAVGGRMDGFAREAVAAALRESIGRHLVADVPVAVFLSGGIDSGAVAGLMIEAGVRDVEGVTIAYEEFVGSREDEAPIAALVATHYGIRHHIRRVTREEFLADLPEILCDMDQPSIDGINTWYASKAVAELGFKVVVSGVGGDELFQGYESFRQLPSLVNARSILKRFPGVHGILDTFGRLQASRSSNKRWSHLAEWSKTIEGAWWLRRSLYAPEDLVELMGEEEADVALGDFDPVEWVRMMGGPLPKDPKLALGQIESSTYLRNQLLRDSDWASMAHSVELRTPLVDSHLLHELQPYLFEFARYPSKALLASAPRGGLPRAVVGRRKTGFGIPIARWTEHKPGGGQADSRAWARTVVAESGRWRS